MQLPFTPLVASLPSTIPFVGPESIERATGSRFEARIGANESAFGVSPIASAAMQEAVADLAWYSDPENHDLREAIAHHHGVQPSEIAIAAGIDDLLGLAVRAFIDRGEVAVASLGAYPTFIYHLDGFGCRLQSTPYRDGHNDLDALSRLAQTPDVRIIYLSNPDNPTGTWHTTADITRFIETLPDHCIFILDEAYAEFAPKDALPPIHPLHPRTIRMRTFSKAHGLAGARSDTPFVLPKSPQDSTKSDYTSASTESPRSALRPHSETSNSSRTSCAVYRKDADSMSPWVRNSTCPPFRQPQTSSPSTQDPSTAPTGSSIA